MLGACHKYGRGFGTCDTCPAARGRLAMPTTTPARYVSYCRVSTQRQGRSGLGLEAQRAAIAAFLATSSGSLIDSGEFVEIETGKRADRPELIKALALAKRKRATLIVAKLDRLARNVAFLSALMESGVDFVAVDNPHATRLTIHILAAVAEDEARRISERTKAALAARRARGMPLGSPANLRRGNSPAPAMNRAKANADAERMRPVVESLIASASGLRDLARRMNAAGYLTPGGSEWHPTAVGRMLKRLGLQV